MKTVLGLVGEKGSGKETFGNILKKILPSKKITHTRFSDILADTLFLWDLPKTRANLQDLAIIMKNQFGDGTLSHAMKVRIENDNSDIVIIDGIRWMSDVELLKSFPKNILVYITADLKVRFERLSQRAEKSDEKTITFEQFMKEEQKENELLIPKIGKAADWKILNNSTIEDFEKEVINFKNQYLP